MSKVMRYVKAFFQALWMTARGQQPAPRPDAPLRAWMDRTQRLADTLTTAADGVGVDKRARQAARQRIEGREVSAETILSTVRYHAAQEYPYLLQHPAANTLTTIYANNMNDVFLLRKLESYPAFQQHPKLQQTLQALLQHLEAAPKVETLN
jgi:hypothetical protein